MNSEPPFLMEPTRMHRFLNVFICFYRYLTEKFIWPRNYAVYVEFPDLRQITNKDTKTNRKFWYTGKFSGTIVDWESEQHFSMSKRRAERVESSFSGGRVKRISADPLWFLVAYTLVFKIIPSPLLILISGYSYWGVVSPFIKKFNYSFLVKCSRGANLQKERPILQGAEVIQNQICLLYDRALNIEQFPPFSDFAVFVREEERKINSMGYAGPCEGFPNTVRLTLIASVSAGEEVRIFYIPRKIPIEDLKGNSAQGLDNVLVKNSTR